MFQTRRSYEALTDPNHAFCAATMAQQDGVVAIGSDPTEWWAGYETITSVFKVQMEEMSGLQSVILTHRLTARAALAGPRIASCSGSRTEHKSPFA